MLRIPYIKKLYFTQFKEMFTGVNLMEILQSCNYVVIQSITNQVQIMWFFKNATVFLSSLVQVCHILELLSSVGRIDFCPLESKDKMLYFCIPLMNCKILLKQNSCCSLSSLSYPLARWPLLCELTAPATSQLCLPVSQPLQMSDVCTPHLCTMQ